MGQMIEFLRPDGKISKGYLASPENEDAPGVVVVQEWWGMGSPRSHVKETADMLAAAGYHALVPDLFHGRFASTEAEAKVLMDGLNFATAIGQDIRGAVSHLEATGSSHVAVMGFCMGGAMTILSSLMVPGVNAAVCFYGIPPEAAGDPGRIKVPLLAHFAQNDDWCSPAAVDALEEKLKNGKVQFELHRYDARHAFMNHHRPEAHDEAAAKLAWERSIAFLRRTIGI